jgi:hypothetical protein
MSTLPQRPSSQPGDGLGYRVLGFDKKTGDRLEMLRVRPQFAGQPNFEATLRNRIQRLGDFRGAAFARVRQIDKLTGQAAGIAIVSNHVEGARLSDLFGVADSYGVRLDSDAALSLVRQLISAIADLHTCGPDISHGCIAPERLVVMKDGRVIVTEYILGAALEGLQWPRKQFWQDFRIALPSGTDPATIDQQTDLMQIGVLALALLAGRGIYGEKQYPLPLSERLKTAKEGSATGAQQPVRPGLNSWLQRLLRVDGATPFVAADEALVALDAVLATGYQATTQSLIAFIDRCHQASPDLRPKEMTESGESAMSKTQEIADKPGTASGDKPAAPPAAQATPAAKPADPKATQPAAPAAKTPPPAAAKPGAPAAPSAATPPAGTPAGAKRPGEPITGKPAPVGADAAKAVAAARDAHTTATAAADAKKPASAPAFGSSAAKATSAASGTGALLGGETMVDDRSGHADDHDEAEKSGSKTPLLIAASLVILAAGGFVAFKYMSPSEAAPTTTAANMPASKGTLSIDASPKTATVFIDDAPRGTTPLKVDLPAGNHTVRLDGGEGLTRTFPVTITPGKEVSHLVELARDVQTGSLEVRSDPAGARVQFDGRGVGNSPVTLNDLQPGDHTVVVDGPQGGVKQTVKVIAGTRSSVMVPLAAAAPASPAAGWVSVSADAELQVFEGGQLLGSSRTDKIMMPAGDHSLEFANDGMGFRVSKSVAVQPGKVARVSIPLPDGTISVNAVPWAEVLVDGVSAGQTPVGNLSAKAGSHDVVFRHPKFGEKKQTVVVKPGQGARLTVDMTK